MAGFLEFGAAGVEEDPLGELDDHSVADDADAELAALDHRPEALDEVAERG